MMDLLYNSAMPSAAALLLALILAVLSSACEADTQDSAQDHFQHQILPLLEDNCTSAQCHGQTSPIGPHQQGQFIVITGADGAIDDVDQARQAALAFVEPGVDPEFSAIIRQPLAADAGGLVHGGGTLFEGLDDPRAQRLADWIDRESQTPGSGDHNQDPQGTDDARRAHFRDQVLPALLARNCATSSCHGATATNGLILDPGLPGDDGVPRFSPAIIDKNYAATRPFLALGGDPAQSRLLKKALPLDQGGITHRGGNRSFFVDDQDQAAQAIRHWADLERRRELARPDLGDADWHDDDAPALQGLIYRQGPLPEADYFGASSYTPGGDLYLRSPVDFTAPQPTSGDGDRNLTAPFHDGDADIRHPAVSRDGRRLAFAMRRSGDSGHSLFELDLSAPADAPQALRRLTDDEGADIMPTYGPDHRLYFVSDRGQTLDETGQPNLAIFGLQARPDQAISPPRQLTFGLGAMTRPHYFDVGALQGRLVVAQHRRLGFDDETVGFSMPLGFDADFHIYFGTTADDDHLMGFSELPDGRALTIAADPANRWPGGRLALIDRSLGPDLGPHSLDEATVPAFARTYRVLDDATRARGISLGGVYQGPRALPDGSIIVAWAPGPVDLSGSQPPRFRLLRLTLSEGSDRCTTLGCLPRIERTQVLIESDDPDHSIHAVQPVITRPTSTATADWGFDFEVPTTFRIDDPSVHRALIDRPFAAETKSFATTIHYLRFLQARPLKTSQQGALHSLGGHVPAAILGEIPVANDGTVHVNLPAGQPFRIQYLDRHRRALSPQHNRWFFGWPGQAFAESRSRHHFDTHCGTCHGAQSGQPEDIFGPLNDQALDLRPLKPPTELPTEPIRTDNIPTDPIAFDTTIAPLLQARCSTCHSGAQAAGGLRLRPDDDTSPWDIYADLLGADHPPLVDAMSPSARNSRLIAIAGRHLIDAIAETHDGADHPPTDLDDDELLTLIRWIDTGALFRAPGTRHRGGSQ